MRIAVVGASGAVGKELVKLLEHRKDELLFLDAKSLPSFDGVDLAFFCVSEILAKKWIPLARKAGALCIDSSSAFRNDPNVPLVIPEINAPAIDRHQGLIASPNCTTTLMLLPLAPLHRKFKIKRIVAATYQAVSGAGRKGMQELENQTRAHLNKIKLEPEVFPHSCAFNLFPHESEVDPSGYVSEERKMHEETRKILEDETIAVTARCIRVPVFRVHSQALNVEFTAPFCWNEALDLIGKAPGVTLKDTPLPIDVSGQKPVFCGRLRLDHSQANTLEMWVVGDQLLKGAALNMIQIAEKICLN